MMADSALTSRIIGAAIEVHRELGPGLLESAYESCLAHELNIRGIPFERQVAIAVMYKGLQIDCGFRADFIVDDTVILELKAVDKLAKIHEAQVITYLKITGKKLGLILNFNEILLKNGIQRIILE